MIVVMRLMVAAVMLKWAHVALLTRRMIRFKPIAASFHLCLQAPICKHITFELAQLNYVFDNVDVHLGRKQLEVYCRQSYPKAVKGGRQGMARFLAAAERLDERLIADFGLLLKVDEVCWVVISEQGP